MTAISGYCRIMMKDTHLGDAVLGLPRRHERQIAATRAAPGELPNDYNHWSEGATKGATRGQMEAQISRRDQQRVREAHTHTGASQSSVRSHKDKRNNTYLNRIGWAAAVAVVVVWGDSVQRRTGRRRSRIRIFFIFSTITAAPLTHRQRWQYRYYRLSR